MDTAWGQQFFPAAVLYGYRHSLWGTEMRQSTAHAIASVAVATILMTLPSIGSAKGCLKGAAVGGVVGHVAGHHAVVGAAAGCVIEHHREKVKEREERKNEKNDPGKKI